jgi:hypothetical protein
MYHFRFVRVNCAFAVVIIEISPNSKAAGVYSDHFSILPRCLIRRFLSVKQFFAGLILYELNRY